MQYISKFILILLIAQLGCAAPRSYNSFADWDANSGNEIERREFVDGYMAMNYFDKWSRGKSSITYPELYTTVFASMDNDKSNQLTLNEFNAQIKFYYFGMFNESFAGWDDDANASIDKSEFYKHISTTNLAYMWDTNGDKYLTEYEMAGGMFYICDSDSNGRVNETELSTWKANR